MASLSSVGAAAVVAACCAVSCAPRFPPYPPSEVCRPVATGSDRSTPAALIDDAEDGNDQVVLHDRRNGFFYTIVDAATVLTGGSTMTHVRPTPLLGGPDGSRCAWNLRGRLADRKIAFVGLGVNMRQPKTAYNAARFAGITFQARRAAGSVAKLRVHFPDWNTDPDGGVCLECFNEFKSEVALTEQWTTYTLPFESLRQEPDWGSPHPPHLDSARLFGIHFRMYGRDEPFDVWLDNIAFIEKPAPPPPAVLSFEAVPVR